ncbi:glycine-rich protein [Aeromicrobium sp. UC242_57]|uniref:glycine-rich protein n=1 Tax=Aeromicrobium sp. UC242_57 TaxID=3374624 RepID=UPI0037ADC6E0
MVAKVVVGAMVVAVMGPLGVAEADPSSGPAPELFPGRHDRDLRLLHTGAEQTFVVPAGPSELTMDLRGASGGMGGTGNGGRGGVASQSLSIGAGSDSGERIHAGQTLYVEVGGAGSNYSGPGGFNGGGTGASSGYGGGGGGASDIRTLSQTTALTVSDTRLIVAGGGGGGGNCGNSAGQSDGGGAGQPGRAPCGNGAVPGGGGAGTGGSATPPATAGQLGQGGAASGAAGGGGGGFYGGGGGLGGSSFVSAGGGGGSSWTVEADGTTGPAAIAGHGAVTISYALAAQQITFPALSGDARVGTTVDLAATGGGSSQPVTFSVDPSTTNEACVVSGDPDSQTVSFLHVGDCVIAADQAGDAGHTAATTATRTIPVLVGAQSITFTTTAPTAASVTGTYRPAATGGERARRWSSRSIRPPRTTPARSRGRPGGPDGQVVSFDRAGVCVVAADQAGSNDYAAASSMTQSIPVSLATSSVGMTLASGQVVLRPAC